jgi:ubiquinone/menaquinone biosynthesis C-methylase UbiE
LPAYPDRISFGIDIDLDALKLGKTLSERTCLVNAAAEALPFKDSQFDLVFARVSLPYTNIPASLREIRRVLKTSGRVVTNAKSILYISCSTVCSSTCFSGSSHSTFKSSGGGIFW